MRDDGFKYLPWMSDRFVNATLADGRDLDQVLLGVKENDPERFAVQKTHLGAQLGDGQRAIDRERLSFLA